jgi:hypothetical protein
MKSKLHVRPVQQYRTPRYPAWNDPNPLDHPDALPFPFSQRVLSWILSSGLLATGGDILAQKSPADTLYNPFPAENRGLPYRPIIFGTGIPDRMTEKDILAAIEKGFLAEGVNLKPNYVWRGNAGSVMLDGYDSTSHLGYTIVNYHRHGQNMGRSESAYPFYNPTRFKKPGKAGYAFKKYQEEFQTALKKKDIYNVNALRYYSARQDTFYVRMFNDFIADLKAERPVREDIFYKILLYDHYLCSFSKYTPVVKTRVQALIQEEDTTLFLKKMKAFCAIKDQILLNVYYGENFTFYNELEQLTAYAIDVFEQHPKKWAKRQDDYYLLLNELYSLQYFDNNEVITRSVKEGITLFTAGQNIQPIREQLATLHQDIAVDMDEFQEIMAQSATREAFIIPITYHEPQTTLPNMYFISNVDIPEEVKNDAKKRDNWAKPQREKQEQERIQKAMQRLENDVRMYIRWAKSQGRF